MPSMRAVEMQRAERWALDQIRDLQRSGIEGQGGGGSASGAEESGSPRFSEPPCSIRLLQFADDFAAQAAQDADVTFDSIASFTDALAAIDGRKLLLFVSEGMSSRPGGVAYDYVRTLCDGSGAREGVQYAMDTSALGSDATMNGQLTAPALAMAGEDRQLASSIAQVVARANSSGVTFWTLGAKGLTASGTGAEQSGRMTTTAVVTKQRADAEDVLHALAVDTGGRAVLESNDFGTALDQFAEDLSGAYSIAYSSPRAGDGKIHRIRLETSRPGVRLRYRQSWRDSSTEEDLAGLLAGSLDYGIDRPGLGAVATIGRQSGDASAQRLILRVTLPRDAVSSLPMEKGARRGFLRLAIVLRPAGGKTSPVRARTITIDTVDGESDDSGPRVFDVALPEVGAGAVVVVGVRDELSGETGVLRVLVGES
jgi:VWFA-related protein